MSSRSSWGHVFLVLGCLVLVPPAAWSDELGSDWLDLSPEQLQQRVDKLPSDADIPGDVWDRLWQHWTPEQKQAVQAAFRRRDAKRIEESSALTHEPDPSDFVLQGPGVVTGNGSLGVPSPMTMPPQSGGTSNGSKGSDPFQPVSLPARPAQANAPDPVQNANSESHFRNYLHDELTGDEFEGVESGYRTRKNPNEPAAVTYVKALTGIDPQWFTNKPDVLAHFLSDPDARHYILSHYGALIPQDFLASNPYVLIEIIRSVTESTRDDLWWFVDMYFSNNWRSDVPDAVTVLEGLDHWASDWMTRYPKLLRYFYANPDTRKILEERLDAARIAQLKATRDRLDANTYYIKGADAYQPEIIYGALLVQEQYLSDLTRFRDELNRIKGMTRAQKIAYIQNLMRQSSLLDDAYVNMVQRHLTATTILENGVETHDMHGVWQKEYEDLIKAGKHAEAANTRWGIYLAARDKYIQLLDQNPILGLKPHTWIKDNFLWYAFEHTVFYDDDGRIELLDQYIDANIDYVTGETNRAASIEDVDDLLEFGTPRYLRQQQSVIGTMDGMHMLQASAWVSVLVGHMDVKDSENVFANMVVEGSLSVVAGLGWFIPVVGPGLAVGADAILVYRSGNELIVQYYDAKDAQKYAGITGYRYAITEEDKRNAAAGKFVFTTIGAIADVAAGTTSIKYVKSTGEGIDVAGLEARAAGAVEEGAGDLLPGLKVGEAPEFTLPGVSDDVNEMVSAAAREGVPGDVIESIVNRVSNDSRYLERGMGGKPITGAVTPEGQIQIHNELVIAAANAQDLTILVQKGSAGRLPGQTLATDMDELLTFAGDTRPVNPVLETDLPLLQEINAKVATKPKPPAAGATADEIRAYETNLQAWNNSWSQDMINAVQNGILPRSDSELLKMWEWNPYEATGALEWQAGQLGGLNQIFTPEDLAAIRKAFEEGPPRPQLPFNPSPTGPVRLTGQPPRPGPVDPGATLPYDTVLPLPGTVSVVPRPAEVQVVEDGARLLDDLDTAALNQLPRQATPGDAAFLRDNGLEPKLKIEIEGRTYYLSEPFQGPQNRISVIAYQVTADGKLLPRTWYISKEHGLWRAAFACDADGLIHKGPRAMVDFNAYQRGEVQIIPNLDEFVDAGGKPKDLFVNEAAANLDPRLQAALGDWTHGKPVRNLGDATDRAFFGPVERAPAYSMGTEFQQAVKFDDVVFKFDPLNEPGMRPDLSNVQGRWQLPADHPYYPNAEVMTLPSLDGSRVYTVVRDANGNVFVPTINELGAGLSPFGTPTRVGDAGKLVDTPWQKVGGEYTPASFGNDLNGFFARNWEQLAQQPVRGTPFITLPPGAAAPLSPVRPMIPWWDVMALQGARTPFFVSMGEVFNWAVNGNAPASGTITFHVMQPVLNSRGAPVLMPAANQPVLVLPWDYENTAFPGAPVPFSQEGFDFQFPKGVTDAKGMLTLDDMPLQFYWGPPPSGVDSSLYGLNGVQFPKPGFRGLHGPIIDPMTGKVTGFRSEMLGGSPQSVIVGGRNLDPGKSVLPGLDPWRDDAFSIGDTDFQIYLYPPVVAPRVNSALKKLGKNQFWENNPTMDAAKGAPADGLFKSRGSWGQDYDDQWDLKAIGLDGSGKGGWPAVSARPSSTIVAVIDTGLDWHHPDIDPKNIWRNEREIPGNHKDDDGNGYVDDIIGWDFIEKDDKPWDYDGHGTMVAGIIAAAHNGEGIVGVDPNVRIMVLKALNNLKQTRASYVAKAMVYAVDNGAKVINLSVSGKSLTRTGRMAVDYARSKGVLVVAAAGNAGAATADYAPAGYPGVLTVAAIGPDGKRAGFSNWGPEVDIAAPGVEVLSLRARGTDILNGMVDTDYKPRSNFVGRYYYRVNGTSFAAPLVSGTASLLLSKNPKLGADDVERMLLQSAHDADVPGVDQYTGYGVLDAAAALDADPKFFIDAQLGGLSVVNKGGKPYVQVTGTADADKFKQAWIELGKGEDPKEWKKVAEIGKAVREGVLGDIAAKELGGAKQWVIRLVVEHKNGRRREIRTILNLG